MSGIPFAENLPQHLPGSYNKNLATLTEIQIHAMHEDNRRWRECEERFKPLKNAADKSLEKKRAAENIVSWLNALKPNKYQEDMRRRMNTLREKHVASKNG